MFKKISLLALAPLLFLFMGQGCGKGLSAEQQQSIQPVTLNYWTVFNDVDELRRLALAYQQIRSYVTVNIRQVRFDEFDALFSNALADDEGPDIVSMHTRWLNGYQNRLSPMPTSVQVANVQVKGQYIKETVVTNDVVAMPTLNNVATQYVNTVSEDVVIDNQIYGLPLALDTLVLYYNKDLLDKSGVAIAPKTWDDFLIASTKGTVVDKDGNIVQSGVALGTAGNVDNSFDIVSLLMMQNGIEMASGGRVLFAEGLRRPSENHPALEAMKFYTDFAIPTQEVYSWNNEKGNALQEFINGTTVFYFGYAFDKKRIQTGAPQMNLSVIPVPQLNETTPINVANYWVESVVKKSERQSLAWDFLKFIASANNVATYVEKTGQPSPLRSQIVDQQQDPDLAPFAFQALTAKNWYHGGNIAGAEKAFDDLIIGYTQPLGERQNLLQRNSELIQRAAQVVQQTMIQ